MKRLLKPILNFLVRPGARITLAIRGIRGILLVPPTQINHFNSLIDVAPGGAARLQPSVLSSP